MLLSRLVTKYPDNALVNYHCAWSFDVLGLEADAVPYYEKAIQIGLNETNAMGAFIGLGSHIYRRKCSISDGFCS